MSVVYFIQAEAGGPVKIGRAQNPGARLKYIQTGHPERLVLRRTLPGGADAEKTLHRRFMAQRLEGEWFECAGLLARIVAGEPLDWWEDVVSHDPDRPRCAGCRQPVLATCEFCDHCLALRNIAAIHHNLARVASRERSLGAQMEFAA